MFGGLEFEQDELLTALVERSRSIADRGARWFLTDASIGSPEAILDGAGGGMPGTKLDVEVLADEGYVRIRSYESYGHLKFVVAPAGFERYETQRRGTAEQVETVATEVISYIDGAAFRGSFPEAYGLWRSASDLLWGADSDEQHSTIGHKTREAMQAFVNALVARHNPPDVESDVARTIMRLTAVIDASAATLGDADRNLLGGLVAYWRGLNSVVQRLEHSGPAKQGEPATWEDARRVVFNCAVVMSELARELG